MIITVLMIISGSRYYKVFMVKLLWNQDGTIVTVSRLLPDPVCDILKITYLKKLYMYIVNYYN